MLGLIFIYFIWKYFAELAERHRKSRWGWGIAGVAFYYASQLLIGALMGIMYMYQGTAIDTAEELTMTLVGLPVAILMTVGLYYILKSIWEKQVSKPRGSEILD